MLPLKGKTKLDIWFLQKWIDNFKSIVLSAQKELGAQILTAVSSETLFWILKILVSYSTVYYPG